MNYDKIKENSKQIVRSAAANQSYEGKSAFQLQDNRPNSLVKTNISQTYITDNRPKSIIQKKQVDDLANRQHVSATKQKKENNTGLPDNLKSGMENLSGLSMDDVKVHYNSDKPAQLQAHAYAQGTDIHVSSGQEKHLPHEAWHVVQQKQGRVKPTMQMQGRVNVNDDKGLEMEADVMGGKAFQFLDKRTETIVQRKLQGIANNSAKAIQVRTFQDNANKILKVKQAVQLQTITDYYSSQQPHQIHPLGIIQRREVEALALASEKHPAKKRFTTINEVMMCKDDFSADDWRKIVLEYNNGLVDGQPKLRFIPPTTKTTTQTQEPKPKEITTIERAGQIGDAVGYVNTTVGTVANISDTLSNSHLGNLLKHTPLGAISAANTATKKAGKAKEALESGNYIAAARHGIGATASSVKSVSDAITVGSGFASSLVTLPVSYASSIVNMATDIPEYKAMINEFVKYPGFETWRKLNSGAAAATSFGRFVTSGLKSLMGQFSSSDSDESTSEEQDRRQEEKEEAARKNASEQSLLPSKRLNRDRKRYAQWIMGNARIAVEARADEIIKKAIEQLIIRTQKEGLQPEQLEQEFANIKADEEKAKLELISKELKKIEYQYRDDKMA